MKRVLFYFLGLFIILFMVIYTISIGVGIGEKEPGTGKPTGFWLKIDASTPMNEGMEDELILKTGRATYNPYMELDIKSSKDCVSCHFKEMINFSNADHMKGSVKLTDLTDVSCKKCHDVKAVDNVSSDMALSVGHILPSDKINDAALMAGVTCIGCHGTVDGNHYKTVTFTPKDCASCHDKPDDCSGVNANPLATGIASNFTSSSHYTSVSNDKVLAEFRAKGLVKTFNNQEYFSDAGGCLSCHQNSSFKRLFAETEYYADADGNKYYKSYTNNNTSEFLTSPNGLAPFGVTLLNDNNSVSGIACQTCHDLHSGSLTRKDVMDDGKVVLSAEFNLCTQCHFAELNYTWDKENNRYDYTLDNKAPLGAHVDLADNATTIIDTHFKGSFNGQKVAGYNINAAALRACSSCHDSHMNSKFDSENIADIINVTESWSQSAHADYKKESFNKDDFDTDCMRCHSGYEAAKVFTGVTDYTKLDNASSMLSGTSGEVISCVACHSLTVKKDDKIALGDVRPWIYDNLSFSWAKDAYADPKKDTISKDDIEKIGSSIQCYYCHDGVRSGRIIETFADNDTRLSEPFERKHNASHYSPASASIWGNIAYEFMGKSYSQSQFPEHATNTGKKGGTLLTKQEIAAKDKTYIYSCIDCHDFDGTSHSSEPMISKTDPDATDPWAPDIMTGIKVTDDRVKKGCFEDKCHGADGTKHAGKAEANKQAFNKALEEVMTQFEKTYNMKLDYRSKTFVRADNPSIEFTAWGGGQAGRELYGAAHNIFLMAVLDDGIYSHNPIYTKQLLWDMMELAGGTFSAGAKFFVNNERP